MPRKALGVILTVMILLFAQVATLPMVAQGNNLLQNGGFETNDYKQVRDAEGATFNVPNPWNGWVQARASGDPEWRNLNPTGYPHTGLFKFPAESAISYHVARGYATFTAAVFQTVSVPAGSNVRGSASGFMERSAGGAAPVPGGQFRVGIDPNGGTDPNGAGIIWSNWVTTPNSWQTATVDATASAGSVTLFLYATQSQPSDPNSIYWDSASLVIGGSGAAAPVGGTPGTPNAPGTAAPTNTPVVPTPAFASAVVPQPPQPDGSIVHLVQQGDTLDAIAVAYRVTRTQILELNGLSSGSFLQIGQLLTISNAPEQEEEPEAEDEASAEDEPAEEEEAATSQSAARGSIVGGASAAEDEEDPEADEAEEPTESIEPTEEPTETPTEEPATETPAPTSTDAPPAPVREVAENNETTASTTTAICVAMFEDANQNRIQETGEALLSGGTITVRSGAEEIGAHTTDGASEPFCFEDIDAGDYVAVAAAPEGYGLTTSSQLRLRVQNGLPTTANFGAAEGVAVAVAPVADPAESNSETLTEETAAPDNSSNLSSLLQISGIIVIGLAGLVLVGGLGAALLLRRR